jgi:hypothetical protein
LKNSFTTIILTAILTFILTGIILPQHQQNNDDRRMPMMIEKTDKLIDRVKEKLDDLDADYLSRLNRRDYSRAKKDLHKIYELLEAIRNRQDVEPIPVITAMPDPDYRSLVNSINNESFEENKVSVLQSSVKYNYFSVDQIIGLMGLSTFSSWKLKALELTYPFVVDKNNSYKIINALTFSQDKQKAREIIDRN